MHSGSGSASSTRCGSNASYAFGEIDNVATRERFKSRTPRAITNAGERSMKAAQLLVKCLENEGVEYIFGLPGEENLRLLRDDD